ncbi:MAG: serine/threonine protein kinase [Chitinophagaceae bacterium]|nr:serine/threonine protein kinase [Chitinophagaceae bacterium]
MNQGNNDQYVILHKIGEGGMGTVYLAEDTMLERKVAIKSLNKPSSPSAESLDSRFQQEALALARLNHPNITHLYSFVPRQDTYWMVMEYVDGQTLEDLLRLRETVGARLACSIIAQILDGLEHAHRKGIIHRDLKPANVMISAEGEVKIMDFGIARIRNSQRLTQHGKSVGTLEYMAPEQIQGKEGDELTDIYAVGNILYELLSGQPPFRGDTDYHLMKAKLEEKAPLNPVLSNKVSNALQQVIFKALERNPAKRYENVRQFKDAILKSVTFPLLKESALTEALSGYDEEMLLATPQKTAAPVVEKIKKIIPAVPVGVASSLKKINVAQPIRYWRKWGADKPVKLLVAVVVVCALLLTWNHFKGNDKAITLQDGQEPENVVQQQPVSQVKTAARQTPVIEPAFIPAPLTPVREQLPAEGTGSGEVKEKPKQKPREKKDIQPPVKGGNETVEVVAEDPASPPPVQKTEPRGPVSVPAGRRITVVLNEDISSEEKSRDGGMVKLYSDEEVSVNGIVIIKRGAAVTGKIVDVVPSTGKRKALIGFVIHSVQARDGSNIRVRSDRFRLKAQNDHDPAVFRSGSLFSVELGKGLVN